MPIKKSTIIDNKIVEDVEKFLSGLTGSPCKFVVVCSLNESGEAFCISNSNVQYTVDSLTEALKHAVKDLEAANEKRGRR